MSTVDTLHADCRYKDSIKYWKAANMSSFGDYSLVTLSADYRLHRKETLPKFETYIPRKGIARPQSNFYIHVSVSNLFIARLDLPITIAGKYLDRSWEYINHSQTHECGYWGLGQAIPFLGKNKWNFRCSVDTKVSVFRAGALTFLTADSKDYSPCGNPTKYYIWREYSNVRWNLAKAMSLQTVSVALQETVMDQATSRGMCRNIT